MGALLVQGDGLQDVDGLVEDGAAGGLVDAAALHAHQAVLDDVQQADAVLAAHLVQVFHQLHGAHLLAVHGGGDALFKVDGHISGHVGGLLGADAQLQEAGLVVLGLVGGVFQVHALVGQVPEVFVLGVVGLAADAQGDVVGLGVVDLLVAALDVPLAPGGDDGHIGGEGLEGQLKADLVVALAGAAVADGVGALLDGDVGQGLGDAGPGKRSAQQIVLVLGAELQGGEDVIFDKVLFQVQHIQLGRAGLFGLFFQAVQLGALAHVARHGDDLAVVVVFFQPGDDDGGIQPTGIGQHDLFDVLLFLHDGSLLFRRLAGFTLSAARPVGAVLRAVLRVCPYYTRRRASVNAEKCQTFSGLRAGFEALCIFMQFKLNIMQIYSLKARKNPRAPQ